MNEKQLWTMPAFALQYQKKPNKKRLIYTTHQLASSAVHCSRLQVCAWATDASLLTGITSFYVMSTCSHAFSLCQKKWLEDGQKQEKK